VTIGGPQPPLGEGPGELTADGCSVEVYRALPPAGEPELIHAAIPAGARVLDLGCGTGRLAAPLRALGHEVVAVDESAAMLAQVRGATTVQARIEDLALARRFDAVLLASHLVNTADRDTRLDLLDACRRHVEAGGRVLVQWHPPEWFDALQPGISPAGTLGPVSVVLEVLELRRGLLAATVTYELAGQRWLQRFSARRLGPDRLRHELTAAGLRFDSWLDPDRTWFAATAR
jgi:SAM-dependent methyltransferase